MATRNFVPRADGEGSLGTSAKKWSAVHADNIYGNVTGNLTGDVTGNADTATTATNAANATNDGNGNNIATTYLPLSGGTMTGDITLSGNRIIKNSSNEHGLLLYGGSTVVNGAVLTLYGNNSLATSAYDGSFLLRTGDGTSNKDLIGRTDGTLTWNGKEIERVNASGTNYIRYDSGLQICWGSVAGSGDSSGTTVTFPVAFDSAPVVTATANSLTSSTNHVSVQVGAITKTSCWIAVSVNTIWSSSSVAARYIAIGYWK